MKKLSIILIDDCTEYLEIIDAFLEPAGHTVLCASSGDAGLALFYEHDADLIITDIMMPKRTGVSVIDEIREGGSTIPIIAISGGGSILTPELITKMGRTFGATSV